MYIGYTYNIKNIGHYTPLNLQKGNVTQKEKFAIIIIIILIIVVRRR